MRKKRSVWKRIRWFLLTEIVTLIVIAIVAQVIYNDTKKSVKLEVESRMDFAASEAKGQRKESADQLLRFTFLIQELFLGEPFWQYDKDFEDCLSVACYCDYFDNEYYNKYYDVIVRDPDFSIKGDGLFVYGTICLLTVSDYPKGIALDDRYDSEVLEKTAKTTWDLTKYFDKDELIAFLEPMGFETFSIDEMRGHETSEGHFIPTMLRISQSESVYELKSKEYREDDVVRAARNTDSEGSMFYFLQRSEMDEEVVGMAFGEYFPPEDGSYITKTWEFGSDDYFSENANWHMRINEIYQDRYGEISYGSKDEASVAYYVLIDVGTIIGRKACRKILAFALCIQGFAIMAMLVWWGVDRRRRELKKLRDTFINAMAHELKTPVAVVRNTAEYLATGAKPEKQEHYLGVLLRESDSMNAKLEQMLTYTRVMDESVTLRPERTDWNKLAEDSLASYSDLIAQKGMTVDFSVKTYERPNCDPALIGMVIDNLIANAVRYGEPGSTIVVKTENEEFSVWNKTAPLSDAELAEIWTPMFETEKKKADSETGGMGLAISAGILDRHGASYGAENEGDGLLFWFDFAKAGDIEKARKYAFISLITTALNIVCAVIWGSMYLTRGQLPLLLCMVGWLAVGILNAVVFAQNRSAKAKKPKKKREK